jgi:ribonuclease HI
MYYLYTDGGCIRNGLPNARAKYAFLIYDVIKKEVLYKESGNVNKTKCKIKEVEIIFEPSSIRAELLAVTKCLEKANSLNLTNCTLYTDSMYCYNIMSKWLKQWKEKSVLAKKAHVDLLCRLYPLLNYSKFVHINSHQAEPKDETKKLNWYYNKIVDSMCEIQL